MEKIRIVTDSASDMPADLARATGTQVVPIYLRFGERVYRDGIDISNEEFFRQLAASPVHPATSQPTPEDFSSYYQQSCAANESVISIHISSKISGTYNSALTAKRSMPQNCKIEVIDSTFNSAGTILTILEAARQIKNGLAFENVVQKTRQAIDQIQMLGVFSTMKYLARSGRVNRSVARAADFLNVMPLLTFHAGEITRAGFVRTLNKGMERLVGFVKNKPVRELIIVHSAIPEKARLLMDRLAEFLPRDKMTIAHLGAALGVHGGPGVLLVALRLDNE